MSFGNDEPASCAKCHAPVNVRPHCDWEQGVDLCDPCAKNVATMARRLVREWAETRGATVAEDPSEYNPSERDLSDALAKEDT